MGLSTLTLAGLLLATGQAPDDIKTINHRNIQIPLKFVAGRRSEVRELLLFVSRNQGQTWEQEAVATPDKDAFPFFAPADGLYFFQVMIVDKRGGRDPADVYATPPGLKVLVDTTAPVIRLSPAERTSEEVFVAWELQEAYADMKTFRVEYATYGTDGSAAWRPVPASPALTGNAKFRPAAPGAVRVRLTVLDMAGNKGELVKDVAALGSNSVSYSPSPPAPTPVQPTSLNLPPMNPTPSVAANSGAPGLVLPPDPPPSNPSPMAIGTSEGPPSPPPIPPRTQPFQPVTPQPAAQPVVQPQVTEVVSQQEPAAVNPLAVSPSNAGPSPANTLPAPQTINLLDFDLDYNVEQVGPSGVARAELWLTRDDGRTWVKWCEDDDRKSPIAVNLNTNKNAQVEGVYGFRVVVQSGAGLSKGPPVSGDAPDIRIAVDITAPLVKIYNPMPDPNQRDILNIRWEAVDPNLDHNPITLEWSEGPDGPWRPITPSQQPQPLNSPLGASNANPYGTPQRVANSASYPWKLPPNMPTHRVYLRVTARDLAGNVAVAKTPQPIEVDLQKPVAKIQGIVGTRR